MFRNQYDTDVATWSPQGRLHQVEYAMESVKQGSCCLGLRNSKFAVLAALKRSTNELATHQQKLFKIDDHLGIAIAGLTADARKLASHMRSECLNHKFNFESPMISGRLVASVADMHQWRTVTLSRRPYGVGLLVIGYDRDGPHLYQTCPSGNHFEYKAMAIGSRSQSAKTYLEKHFESFEGADLDEMIQHALKALQGPAGDKEVDSANTSVSIVGEGHSYTLLEGDDLKPHLERLAKSAEAKMEEEDGEEGGDEAMDTA